MRGDDPHPAIGPRLWRLFVLAVVALLMAAGMAALVLVLS
jgi:hypothetical protein